MIISIINGSLSQIQETLSSQNKYQLPISIIVTGANSNYSSLTGIVALNNLSSIISITAIGVLQIPYRTNFNGKTIIKKMFGTKQILKEVFNKVVVYEYTPPIIDNVLIDSNGNYLTDSQGDYLQPATDI